MLFFASHAEAGAHDAALILATLANAYATKSCFSQAAMVVGKFEMRFWLPRLVIRTQAQVSVHSIRPDQFARIHFPIRVPERLEFMKRLDKFGSEHFGEQLGTRLSVAVLTGKRAAVGDDEICGLVYEVAEFLDAFSGLKVSMAGTGKQLTASVANGLTSAVSSSFDVANATVTPSRVPGPARKVEGTNRPEGSFRC